MRFDFHIHTHENDEILKAINHLKEIIIMAQTDFDAEMAEINAKLDDIGVDVAAEADKIAAFIAAQPPETDTSSLSGVVDRLSTLDQGIKDIFTAPEPVSPAPVAE